jgi:hypothetical protein
MIDIIAIDPLKPINNKYAICSALPTGFYTKKLIRKNRPLDLTISNIESKYSDRFDDPSYYYGGGNVDGGDVVDP